MHPWHSLRLVLASLLVAAFAAAPGGAAATGRTQAVDGATLTQSSPSGELEIRVQANRLVDEAGEPVILRGVTKAGGEYACVDGWGVFDGPADDASIEPMKAWGINVVRIPLNSACWLDVPHQLASRNEAFVGANYREAVRDYVDLLNSHGLYAILDLHWTGCGDNPCLANWLKPMPDRPYATDFWDSVASTFRDNKAVLFDLFNEPQGLGWECWSQGGCVAFGGNASNEFTVEGMQQMVDQVRQAGATTQPLLLGGLQYANDMRGWLENLPTDPNNGIVASIHLYNFNYPCPQMLGSASANSAIECFTDDRYNSIESIAERHPIVFGELGQDDCGTDFVAPLLEWMAEREFGAIGWAWNPYDCASFPALISDYDGTPTPFGQAFRDAFASTAHTSRYDFTGDGAADPAVFRGGAWFVEGLGTRFLGSAGDVPVPGDYDGDGVTEPGVFRGGAWYLGTGGGAPVFLGLPSDVPVPADFDGDGVDEPAVWRPSTGAWLVQGKAPVFWGVPSDVPVPADFDGDGAAELAVWRPATGAWFVQGASPVFRGVSSDVPVPADFDGDGAAEPTVWRPATGGWFGASGTVFRGLSSDVPVPADYDGDGSAEPTVWRPATGGWFGAGAPVFLGLPGDEVVNLPAAVRARL